jgi:hypothetical protein
MRKVRRTALLMCFGFGLLAGSHSALAQTCNDEESMVAESKKALGEVLITVKQESLPDFEKAYHQKNVVNKLSFYGIAVDSLLTCEEKVEQDSATAKDSVDAAKAKRETYAKLKDKIQHDHDTLKGLAAPKDAKQYVEKLDEAT